MVNKIMIKSAFDGNAESGYQLGERYFYGKGVAADRRIAKEWYKFAADKGHCGARYMYGYLLLAEARGEQDLILGIKYLKKAANGMHTGAMLLLARNYFYGVGVKKNEKKAVKEWKRAALIGCPEADYYLGLCYEKGIAVKTDIVKSKRHLYFALENGYTESRTLLHSGKPFVA